MRRIEHRRRRILLELKLFFDALSAGQCATEGNKFADEGIVAPVGVAAFFFLRDRKALTSLRRTLFTELL
jgi:hypothetical protein